MLNTRLILFCLLLLSHLALAQKEVDESSSWRNRIFYGGYAWASFGNLTWVDLSPQVGYMVNERVAVGMGIKYQYREIRSIRFSDHLFGYQAFGRLNLTRQVFAQGEFENISLTFEDRLERRSRIWVPGAFLGGGFFQSAGSRMGFSIMLLYNFLYDPLRSPYPSPWVIRMGVSL